MMMRFILEPDGHGVSELFEVGLSWGWRICSNPDDHEDPDSIRICWMSGDHENSELSEVERSLGFRFHKRQAILGVFFFTWFGQIRGSISARGMVRRPCTFGFVRGFERAWGFGFARGPTIMPQSLLFQFSVLGHHQRCSQLVKYHRVSRAVPHLS